jgi:hypothetical protein
METTPNSVLETFERNRQAVRDLMHFDEIVLKLVMNNLETLNGGIKGVGSLFATRWRRYDHKELINETKPASTSSGSEMRVSKNPIISAITTFLPRKSLKT